MQDRFIVPVTTMLVGLGLWLAFVIIRAIVRRRTPWSSGVDVGASLLAGAVVAYSSFT